MNKVRPRSAITWFYYDRFAAAVAFYRDVLGLESVLDQEWARVFRISRDAFVGLVDARAGKGTCRTQPENAVLLTMVVDDVPAWHRRLVAAGAPAGEIVTMDEIEIRTFFLTDPGGYRIEVQEFLNARARGIFHVAQKPGEQQAL